MELRPNCSHRRSNPQRQPLPTRRKEGAPNSRHQPSYMPRKTGSHSPPQTHPLTPAQLHHPNSKPFPSSTLPVGGQSKTLKAKASVSTAIVRDSKPSLIDCVRSAVIHSPQDGHANPRLSPGNPLTPGKTTFAPAARENDATHPSPISSGPHNMASTTYTDTNSPSHQVRVSPPCAHRRNRHRTLT